MSKRVYELCKAVLTEEIYASPTPPPPPHTHTNANRVGKYLCQNYNQLSIHTFKDGDREIM